MTVQAHKSAGALDAFFGASLKDADPELFASVADELERQQTQIELIASENIVSRAVLEAQGSIMTNKYAEAIRAVAIMAVANLLMWPRPWPSSGPRPCLAPLSPMCSPTAAAR